MRGSNCIPAIGRRKRNERMYVTNLKMAEGLDKMLETSDTQTVLNTLSRTNHG